MIDIKSLDKYLNINIPVRLKNPWFWVGIISTVLAAMGVKPEMFTSWDLVWEAFVDLVSNPYQLACVILAVFGVVNDPTTSGVKDSARAMQYSKPYREDQADG